MTETITRDEFETVKQLLASAATYAESANKQADRNALTIADNALGLTELKGTQQANADAIATLTDDITELKEAQQRTQTQIDTNAQAIADLTQNIGALTKAQERSQKQIDDLRDGINELKERVAGNSHDIAQLTQNAKRREKFVDDTLATMGTTQLRIALQVEANANAIGRLESNITRWLSDGRNGNSSN